MRGPAGGAHPPAKVPLRDSKRAFGEALQVLLSRTKARAAASLPAAGTPSVVHMRLDGDTYELRHGSWKLRCPYCEHEFDQDESPRIDE